MADINQVVLVGRLTRDAELKYTSTGTPVSRLSLAVNRRIKKGDAWVDEASFFDVTLWGKQGEALNQYLTKGKQIAVSGELRQSRWEDSDGQKKSKVEIAALNIQLLGGGSDARGNSSGTTSKPAQGGASPSFDQYEPAADFDSKQFDDDIPF